MHYLYADQDRMWLDTKPNLRREMESRKHASSDINDVQPLIKSQLSGLLNRNHIFEGVHIFTSSKDIPDDYGKGPRLVILPITAAYSKTENNAACSSAEEILKSKGESPRQKQNRLIFLAADHDVVSRLREQARTFLAWKSVVHDIDNEVLNHDIANQRQAKQQKEIAEKSLNVLLKETFKWLLVPAQFIVKGQPTVEWETASISTNAPNLIKEVENKLLEEEWVVSEWSPIHLRKLLNEYYFKNGTNEVNALKVWQDTAHYIYLPRLINFEVFRNTCAQAIQSKDYFAMADGKDGDRYLGFAFGIHSIISFDDLTLLIECAEATKYEAKLEAEKVTSEKDVFNPSTSGEAAPNPVKIIVSPDTTTIVNPVVDPEPPVTCAKKRFYGSVELDPIKAKLDFLTIMDEVVQQFTTKFGVEVKISIEIEALTEIGFDESIQRSIKENCSVLKFQSAEFDTE